MAPFPILHLRGCRAGVGLNELSKVILKRGRNQLLDDFGSGGMGATFSRSVNGYLTRLLTV